MITVDLLQTWFSENAIRRFPLNSDVTGIDDDGIRTLPDSLLVGMEVTIPSTMTTIDDTTGLEEPSYVPYLSKVIISEYEVVITLAANGVDVAAVTVDVSALDDQKTAQTFAFASLVTDNTDFEGVGGKVFLGPTSSFLPHSGVYTFSGPLQTGISLDCIHSYPECIRSLNISGTRVTGDITLAEGDNISLDYDADTNTITVSYVPDEVEGISSKAELLDAIISRFGQPICTVNGVTPDAEGAFELIPAAGGCVEIEVTDHGVIISNPCASPCCDKTVLENLMSDIQGLNARYARLHSYLLEATSNVNTLQNELSILKMSMK